MAFEAARILHHLGCEVRMYDPAGLPVKGGVQHQHPKVQELRQLSEWSEAQFWCSPEQHGNITAVLKNQSELGRKGTAVADDADGCLFSPCSRLDTAFDWLRAAHPRQDLSVCAAFTPAGRLMPSSNRDRLVDVCEELVKMSIILLPYAELLNDRYSEREEKRIKGRLETQAEKEKEKDEGQRRRLIRLMRRDQGRMAKFSNVLQQWKG
ncbi:hypothetical protein QFC21_007118 [Naganishia friedmannii]|uniref:Uncharacterized protein n=1 Tax=Naganishia friedmannii TaxID=89922 RepID=A0ACC2UXZ4_9TREE|nr:hypothetical protein QFC21_007118 [Naganishia friedmannii]